MSEIKQVKRRSSLAQIAESSAPAVDPDVVNHFVSMQDVVVEKKEKTSLEVFLRTRYKLEPDDYSPDLLWIIKALEEYVKVMAVGGNSTDQQHGEMVGRLNLVYVRALRTSESVLMFDTVLHFFDFYEDTVFRAELPYRGIRLYKFGTTEQVAFFQHITAIAQMLADIQTRNKTLKELDFRGALSNVPKTFEKHQAGLAAFLDYYTNF